MKNLIFLLTLAVLCSCKTSNSDNKILQTISLPAKSDTTGTEYLANWFDKFQHPSYQAIFMDSIKAEYPQLMEDIHFLDSIKGKGVKIDFIGIKHPTSIAATTPSQLACLGCLEKLINDSNYLFICAEGSSTRGRLNNLDYLFNEEMQTANEIASIKAGYKLEIPKVNQKEFFIKMAKEDYMVRMVLSNDTSSFFIGEEPKWVYITGADLLTAIYSSSFKELPANIRTDLEDLYSTTNECRTEIVFSRTVRYWLSMKTTRKAAVVYGSSHLEQFKELSERCGVEANFIIPKECK